MLATKLLASLRIGTNYNAPNHHHDGKRPDIIVRRDEGPVILETEVVPARVELDEGLVRDMLGLDEAAVATVAGLRTLLATDPSIHGSKKPELP